jgi:hypothetical protein
MKYHFSHNQAAYSQNNLSTSLHPKSLHLGGGMMATAKTASAQKNGQYAITASLFIQVPFVGFFMIVASLFHIRISRRPTSRSITVLVSWQRYLLILYVASTFIIIRSIFRIAEYIQGEDGSLLKTETYLYLFDATLMFLTMVLFNVFHLSKVISREVLKGTWTNVEGGIAYEYESSVPLGQH